LAINPALEGAWYGRGNILTALGRHDEAFAAYDKALALKPTGAARGGRFNAKMQICDWRNFDTEVQQLLSEVRSGVTGVVPFLLSSIPSSLSDQLQCAKLCIADKRGSAEFPSRPSPRYEHDRIRLAYVSSDLRPHPVSYLIAGLIEGHDRKFFHVTGVSLQPEDSSEFGQRIKHGFDDFIDVSNMSDESVGQILRQREIDIAIDLNGHTKNDRPNIFASRPAPVQVNYLGYPGTMGADYIDYLIADHIVIPRSHQEFYTEKIVYLPNTYQVNDAKRAISDKIFSRNECALPDAGFVFCSFNNNFKILPHVFDCWMRILKRIDGSVLWLLEASPVAASNLRKEAAARGVDPARLVFAARMHHTSHLARHRLADLFLDTMPYNAHTTASDALWAGLPLLTLIGETFAGRVAASLLTAVGLPELITTTLEAYEELAIELATNPEKLAAIKSRLGRNRMTAPLFNTQLFVGQIESAYTAMYALYQANLPPERMDVAIGSKERPNS
jgi:protein O-GlcNAc transferase